MDDAELAVAEAALAVLGHAHDIEAVARVVTSADAARVLAGLHRSRERLARLGRRGVRRRGAGRRVDRHRPRRRGGAQALRAVETPLWAESPTTAVVDGMPVAAARAHSDAVVLPLDALGRALCRLLGGLTPGDACAAPVVGSEGREP